MNIIDVSCDTIMNLRPYPSGCVPRFMDFPTPEGTVHRTVSCPRFARVGLSNPPFFIKKKKPIQMDGFSFWRSRRDLNPRYPFGVHTISSRARYDHFDTAPYVRHSRRLAYNTITALICQVVFLLFSHIFAEKESGTIL